jgi:hypothetical protein
MTLWDSVSDHRHRATVSEWIQWFDLKVWFSA